MGRIKCSAHVLAVGNTPLSSKESVGFWKKTSGGISSAPVKKESNHGSVSFNKSRTEKEMYVCRTVYIYTSVSTCTLTSITALFPASFLSYDYNHLEVAQN